jgi:4-hydroxy-tetrahydrodipicolinate reductase
VTRVVVSGICGRMGGLVAREIAATPGFGVVGGVEIETHPAVGKSLSELWQGGPDEARVSPSLDPYEARDFDVIVDFSTPTQTVACAEKAGATGKGLVVGTTGLTELQAAVVDEASLRSPVVVAPNTSVGVNLLFAIVGRVAAALGEQYDVEIVEEHHRGKRDAPSGTAIRLAEIIAAARGVDPARSVRHGRAGAGAARAPGEIGVHSLRAGGIVGRHRVSFSSDIEEVALSHEAFSREAFARGAVRAAGFVHGRAPGLYDMIDVLGLAKGRQGGAL